MRCFKYPDPHILNILMADFWICLKQKSDLGQSTFIKM